MLTETIVLDYIKRNLGHPIMQLEISDDDIIHYVKNYTLPLFSRYKPYVRYLVIDYSQHPELKLPDGTYKLPIDPNHPILSIADVLQTFGDLLVANYPYNPFPSWSALPDYLMSMTKAESAYSFMMFNFTWEFIRPDRLRIYPKQEKEYLVIKGLLQHSFETIPTDWDRHFLDLALADIYSYIANLRAKYQNYSTPYGDINLNFDYFQSQAENIRNRVMEELSNARPVVYGKVR